MLVEFLDVSELDQLAVLAALLVARRAVHLVVVERVVLEHLEALGRQRDLRIEVRIAPFGVHVGDAEEADVVVVANVLRQRALVLAHVPLADALRDVALLLQKQRHGDGAVETAGLPVHGRTQDAVMQRVLSGVQRGARRRARWRRVGRRENEAFVGKLVHHRRGIADRGAAAVEARVHPADVVHQKDENVGFLAGLCLKRCKLVADGLVLLGMLHDGVHVVGRLHILHVHVLLGVAESRSRRRACCIAADVLLSKCGCRGERRRRGDEHAQAGGSHLRCVLRWRSAGRAPGLSRPEAGPYLSMGKSL